jgi:hypothetical protein
VDLVFFQQTLSLKKVYHFDGHSWDFDADRLSLHVGPVIVAYMLLVRGLGVWRVIATTGRNRIYVGLILLSMMVIFIGPSIANVLSGDGTMDRETFRFIGNPVTVLGFFLTLTVYVNVTADRSSIPAKIRGITRVTFLLFFEGFTYMARIYGEDMFDMAKAEQMRHSIRDPSYSPPDMRYLYRYDIRTGKGVL